jgi:hypothetical protein
MMGHVLKATALTRRRCVDFLRVTSTGCLLAV